MFTTTITMNCNHKGCKAHFTATSPKMTRNILVKQAAKKGFKFVNASTQLCAEHKGIKKVARKVSRKISKKSTK